MDLIKRDEHFEQQIATPVSWNQYLFIVLKFIALFYVLTLFLVDYLLFIHHGQPWLLADYSLIAIYAFILIIASIKMIKKLPMAAIMLAAPTIPLLMLILAVSTFPLLNIFHKEKTSTTFISTKKSLSP